MPVAAIPSTLVVDMTATVALSGAPVRATAAMVVFAGVLAACGAVLAVFTLTADGEAPYYTRDAPSPGEWRVPTSFGTLSVELIERFAGVPGGVHHAGVRSGSDRIRIAVTLTNDRRRGVPFSPGQLRLAFGGRRAGIPPTRPNPPPGSIAAGAVLDRRLEYIVPAARASFSMVFADLDRARATRIDLGALPGRDLR